MVVLEISANPAIPAEERTMRRVTSLTTPELALLLFLFSLFMAVPSAWAQHNGAAGPSASPVSRWTMCVAPGAPSSINSGTRRTMYISGTVLTVPPSNEQDVGKAFARFIENKFLAKGMSSFPNCWSGSSASDAQRGLKGRADCSRWECVETGWTYDTSGATGSAISPTPSVAPVASAPVKPPTPPNAAAQPDNDAVAPAPAAPRRNVPVAPVAAAPIAPEPQTNYAVCWSESPARKTAYFGVPFLVSKVDNQAWAKQYRDFLTMKYGQVGLTSCRTLKSLPEAQQQTQTWMDRARARDTVVDTGWKYQ